MSTTNIIDTSEKSEDTLYPTNEVEDVNKYTSTSDPVVVKLSEVICRQLQKKKDRRKQKKDANAYVTILTCLLGIIMAAVITTKILEDGERTKLYNTFSARSLPPKVYENQKKPIPLTLALLVKSTNQKSQTQIDMLTTNDSVASLKNYATEIPMNKEINTHSSEPNFNATTKDTINNIPTVKPLIKVSSSGTLNSSSVYVFSYLFIVLFILKF